MVPLLDGNSEHFALMRRKICVFFNKCQISYYCQSCIYQVKLGISLHISAAISELPSNIRAMVIHGNRSFTSSWSIHFFTSKASICTVCQRSSDPFYTISYYIKWVTSSCTNSLFFSPLQSYREVLSTSWYIYIYLT